MTMRFRAVPLLLAALLAGCAGHPPPPPPAPASSEPGAEAGRVVPVGEGWARTSVNAVVFRGSAVTSFGDVQYTAYYDAEARVVLAKRQLGSTRWEIVRTRYSGNVRDAHNAISIGVDGSGTLHMAWDEHGGPLRYARAVRPGSLELTDPLPMTGESEARVTYPQFYRLADGDLLFLYRDGVSGGGDVMLNRYDLRGGVWRVVSHPLIAGEGERNAYMNTLAVDEHGGWHLSWVWRETPDVATNHDVLYAYSPDEGRSWRRSDGTAYALPITARTAEVAWPVPQGSELINQTSMTVDGRGRPVIATYWRDPGSEVPQFRIVWRDGALWRMNEVGHRTQPFRLSGGGTRRIPISRPQVLAAGDTVLLVYRDEERGPGVTLALSTDSEHADWTVREVHHPSVGMWEPSYDIPLWNRDRRLHLFLQTVGQGDAETQEEVPPQMVSILELAPTRASASVSSAERHYLFSYFKGNGEDGLHLAHSTDGLTWTALRGGSSFLTPAVGTERLMRDPSIVRGPDGLFHMVWTPGWNERGIGYASSPDLVHWSEQRFLPVMEREPTTRNSWAPELFYDDRAGEYLIFWASTIPGRYPAMDGQDAQPGNPGYNHRIYYVATRDFRTFTPARLLYEPGFSVIDATIYRDGDRYLMFLKDETGPPFPPQKNLRIATAAQARGPWSAPSAPITGKEWAEGPTALRIGGRWHLYYDRYTEHRYGLLTSDDLVRWSDLTDRLSVPAGIRHGTAFPVDAAVARALLGGR